MQKHFDQIVYAQNVIYDERLFLLLMAGSRVAEVRNTDAAAYLRDWSSIKTVNLKTWVNLHGW